MIAVLLLLTCSAWAQTDEYRGFQCGVSARMEGGSHDGWFASNNVNSGNGNFQYSRQNIYIEEP